MDLTEIKTNENSMVEVEDFTPSANEQAYVDLPFEDPTDDSTSFKKPSGSTRHQD